MNILLVDDTQDLLFTQSLLLTRMGHKVKTATNGEEAWEALMKEEFQMVISDYKMPKSNGIELFQKIRDYNFSHYIYLILLTGYGEGGTQLQAMDSGSDDFIRKPFSCNEFRAHIRSAQRIIDLEESLVNENKGLKNSFNDLSHEQEEIHKDLTHAAELQRALSFNSEKDISAKLNCYCSPATEIGGDSLNYIKLQKDVFFFYAIDVSGHGISSAMMSVSLGTMFNYLMEEYIDQDLSDRQLKDIPLKITNYLNQKLNSDDHIDHYFTMLSGIVDNRKNKVYYVQAGHPFPILYHFTKHRTEVIETNGFPVGLLEEATYELDEIDFEHNDRLLVYSDGIFELEESNKSLDQSWLSNMMEKISNYSFNDASQYINEKLNQISSQKPQSDDVSLLLVEFN